jgi:hypothetical protein
VFLIASLASLALAALHLAAPSEASPVRWVCGGDRWYVRTLQDRPKLLPVHKTTFAQLDRIRRPKSIPLRRMPVERQVVTVDALLAPASIEEASTSGEIRVALYGAGARSHVWAFAPHPACNARAVPYRRAQMGKVRPQIRFYGCASVRVTGVLFFSAHPGPSAGEDKVQLRPILGFEKRC